MFNDGSLEWQSFELWNDFLSIPLFVRWTLACAASWSACQRVCFHHSTFIKFCIGRVCTRKSLLTEMLSFAASTFKNHFAFHNTACVCECVCAACRCFIVVVNKVERSGFGFKIHPIVRSLASDWRLCVKLWETTVATDFLHVHLNITVWREKETRARWPSPLRCVQSLCFLSF